MHSSSKVPHQMICMTLQSCERRATTKSWRHLQAMGLLPGFSPDPEIRSAEQHVDSLSHLHCSQNWKCVPPTKCVPKRLKKLDYNKPLGRSRHLCFLFCNSLSNWKISCRYIYYFQSFCPFSGIIARTKCFNKHTQTLTWAKFLFFIAPIPAPLLGIAI